MRFFIAFFISLFIYILLFWVYMTKISEIKPLVKKKSEHIIKIDIKNIIIPKVEKRVKLIKKPLESKKIVQNSIKKKKKRVKKRIIKKKKHIIKKKHVKKKRKKRVIKHKPKKVFKKRVLPKIEPIIDNELLMQPFEIIEPATQIPTEIVAKKENNSLSSFLGTPSNSIRQHRSYPNRKIEKLYGSNFHSFTPTQKRFIAKNLDTIQSITQRVLTQRGYPEGAGRTHQEGTNVVSFNLHPNGTISNLYLKTRIGYRALDNNTLSLIKTAYREYPYPNTTTKIIFYVEYSIYGY